MGTSKLAEEPNGKEPGIVPRGEPQTEAQSSSPSVIATQVAVGESVGAESRSPVPEQTLRNNVIAQGPHADNGTAGTTGTLTASEKIRLFFALGLFFCIFVLGIICGVIYYSRTHDVTISLAVGGTIWAGGVFALTALMAVTQIVR